MKSGQIEKKQKSARLRTAVTRSKLDRIEKSFGVSESARRCGSAGVKIFPIRPLFGSATFWVLLGGFGETGLATFYW